MTEEQEETINRLEKLINIRKNKAGQIKYDNCICSTTAIETILNMLKEKDKKIEYYKKQKDYDMQFRHELLEQIRCLNLDNAEKDAKIEKYKKLLADNLAKGLNNSLQAKQKANTDLEDLNEGWKIELKKKDKVIDLMAKYIADIDNEDICFEIENKYCDKNMDYGECEDCIKQYFERKVEDE